MLPQSPFPWQTAVHPWLKRLEIAFWPMYEHPLTQQAMEGLAQAFRDFGHRVVERPGPETDVIIASVPYGENLNWRKAPMFIARRHFRLPRQPFIWAILAVPPQRIRADLHHLALGIAKDEPDPEHFHYPGLAPNAYITLYEQGRRAGPILALQRLLQSQAKTIRQILIVGEDEPEEAFMFNLVGGYPRIPAHDRDFFYKNLALRVTTEASTYEVTQHQVVDEPPIPAEVWRSLETPEAMIRAGLAFGQRNFFTRMIRVQDLAYVPMLDQVIASQYSEGCFATWDPKIGALVSTITGSARPVDKGKLTEDELAVIVGVRPDYLGALVRHVEGKRNDPPSSEAVELYDMDRPLPRIRWQGYEVPVARSKLHSHRGVASFDPKVVEFAPLDPPYYFFPVSCSTAAQALAVRAAFGRAQSLRNPEDPRRIVFTVLPGHGVVLAEKWVPGKKPFQVLWEAMDRGEIQISRYVPQGPYGYELDPATGRMVLREEGIGGLEPLGPLGVFPDMVEQLDEHVLAVLQRP